MSAAKSARRKAARLAPPQRLDVSSLEIDEVRMMWTWLDLHDPSARHRFFKLNVEGRRSGAQDAFSEWGREARALCGDARKDDKKLVELVSRDPRFLASELVIARVLRWRAQVVVSRYSRDGEGLEDAARRKARGDVALGKLKSLAAAIVTTGRSGSSKHVSLFEVIEAKNDIDRKLRKAQRLLQRTRSKNEHELAQRTDLVGYEQHLTSLIAGDSVLSVSNDILQQRFAGTKIRKHLARAQRLGVSARE